MATELRPRPLRKPLYDSERAEPRATVCVTGATGYIAGPVIARLLAAGHTVHAACRDPANEAKTGHLKALPGAGERLRLFAATLEAEASYDEAVAGCKYVVHLASVVRMMAPKGRERELIIDPSVHGVTNVLGSVNRTPSVEKVVMASSVAAVVGDHWERGRDHVYTEEDWNTTCRDDYLPYHQSKLLSEKKAWELAESQQRWKLIVLQPCLVCGPPLGNNKCESVGFMRRLLNGWFGGCMPNPTYCVVDLDDVAAALTLAMVTKHAKGRYLITQQSFTLRQYVALIRQKWGDFRLPWFPVPYWVVWLQSLFHPELDMNLLHAIWGKVPKFDNSKSKRDLGLTYTEIKVSIDDMVEALIRLGIVKDFRKKRR
ncbi:unnamed protein product [Ostreobium quekettii]|uniref:NAD-dependent epimerase/dehydratase domain-containing protein n=1 Tax=Ostreobium quekettii TaxID=121088 RepID=A0A8S1J3N4_9CHLO|nr:unnamed protein product [Ostreobium quekettii]|eukprot:evm.model.scf_100EXC.3 EVM.evm.TU.scf_100EXC.3   scf_100EXC:12887-16803(+)